MRKFTNNPHTFKAVLSSIEGLRKAVSFSPFPGAYPTRIAFAVTFTNGRKPVRYNGKPVMAMIGLFYRLVRKAGVNHISAIEYDRRGMCLNYCHAGAALRDVVPFRASWYDEQLQRIYHPWGVQYLFGGGYETKLHVHCLANGYKCYCPLQQLPMMQQLTVQEAFDTAFPRKNVRAKTKTAGV